MVRTGLASPGRPQWQPATVAAGQARLGAKPWGEGLQLTFMGGLRLRDTCLDPSAKGEGGNDLSPKSQSDRYLRRHWPLACPRECPRCQSACSSPLRGDGFGNKSGGGGTHSLRTSVLEMFLDHLALLPHFLEEETGPEREGICFRSHSQSRNQVF